MKSEFTSTTKKMLAALWILWYYIEHKEGHLR